MIRFKTYLSEAAGANLHMTHLEDAVLDGGVNGTRNVFQYLQALRDMLGGNTKAPVKIVPFGNVVPLVNVYVFIPCVLVNV